MSDDEERELGRQFARVVDDWNELFQHIREGFDAQRQSEAPSSDEQLRAARQEIHAARQVSQAWQKRAESSEYRLAELTSERDIWRKRALSAEAKLRAQPSDLSVRLPEEREFYD